MREVSLHIIGLSIEISINIDDRVGYLFEQKH